MNNRLLQMDQVYIHTCPGDLQHKSEYRFETTPVYRLLSSHISSLRCLIPVTPVHKSPASFDFVWPTFQLTVPPGPRLP